jgi:hypothetical protein
MADPTQFSFTLLEVTEALIKKQGIHKGKWVLGIEFGLNIGFMGIAPNDAKPGVMVLANNLQLQKAAEPGSPLNLIVDAAVVNPAPTKKR